MLGRDLIIYILQNGLEDKDIFADGTFLDLMTVRETAAKFGVGNFTVLVWYHKGYIRGVTIGDSVYIFKDAKDPREKNNKGN